MTSRAEINATLRRTNIRGKDYIDVSQRVDAFWQLFPDWSLVTEKTMDDGKRVDFVAKAVDEQGRVRATGHAYEVYGKGVNSTSAVENCETSAVGRALGMLGIGVDDNICSAEELVNAVTNQKKKDPEKKVDTPAPEEKTTQPDQPAVTNRIRFIAFCKKHGYDLDEIKERFGITESTNEIRFGALLNQLMDEVQEAKTNGQQRV